MGAASARARPSLPAWPHRRAGPARLPPPDRRGGQALIESCLVIALLALILFGLFEIGRLYTAREINDYASTAGARARSVGFNDFMVHKVVRIASIPNAGRMVSPAFQNNNGLAGPISTWTPGAVWDLALGSRPVSSQYGLEQSRIPLYLAAVHWGELAPILDYERWEDIQHSQTDPAPGLTRVEVRHDLPLVFPFHRAFYAGDEVRQQSSQTMDSHYPLYLQ